MTSWNYLNVTLSNWKVWSELCMVWLCCLVSLCLIRFHQLLRTDFSHWSIGKRLTYASFIVSTILSEGLVLCGFVARQTVTRTDMHTNKHSMIGEGLGLPITRAPSANQNVTINISHQKEKKNRRRWRIAAMFVSRTKAQQQCKRPVDSQANL